MVDANTRQRMALMRMVRKVEAEAAAVSGPVKPTRDRDQPEVAIKIRTAVDNKQTKVIKEWMMHVGCPNDMRGRVWPLLMGILPDNGTAEFIKNLYTHEYEDDLHCAEALGATADQQQHDHPVDALNTPPSVSKMQAADSIPYAQRPTLLNLEEQGIAIAQGNCYYCGTPGHFLRECWKYYNSDHPQHQNVLTTVLLNHYLQSHVVDSVFLPTYSVVEMRDSLVHPNSRTWFMNEDGVLLWLGSLTFRLLEAVPNQPISSRILRHLLKLYDMPWQAKVVLVAEEASCNFLAQLDPRAITYLSDNISLPSEGGTFKEMFMSMLCPLFGSLAAMMAPMRFVSNDATLRIWDSVIWQPDPLKALSILILEVLHPLVKKVTSFSRWEEVTDASFELIQSFGGWADETQRLALVRACEGADPNS
eukprot:TRINITY_DN16486_c0_g1_i1.p1 TRINITY_DN16486_c0_g1~~TRINITY_DN16486_c0_g1_i1.p1  ORF type:complete len:437 (+),score=77.76 TRINITY_DN16486_c0_g1_i1:55-1311(+)